MAGSNTDRAFDAAVIATGAIFPGRGNTTGFWRDIVEGVDTMTDVPSTHWLLQDYYNADPAAADRTYGRRGAFLSKVAFDPLSYGVPPSALASTDTSQLLALVAAREVLDAVELDAPVDRARTSVILGVASATELTAHMSGRLQRPAWIKGMRDAGIAEHDVQRVADNIASNFTPWSESTFPGLLGNVVAGRIANRLDLGGCNYVTDAACASSLSALQIALHELRSGDSDMVLTGGVDALNDILMYMCFSKTPALSPTGDCRALSADADGTMLGEGIGMLALRRLHDAERDGNRIHAVIRGLGAGSDGRATAIYAPLSSGQARTLQRAYDKAGYSPKTVELVEAHGTGTVAGDKAELDGLHAVFGNKDEADSPRCALGSIKSQIGHTKAAAGSASLIKIIEALNRKVLPPTIKITRPAESLDKHSPFYLNTSARPWIRGNSHPRRASLSSFGFGGSNFHATLEEYNGAHAAQPVRVLPGELLLLSAKDKPALLARLQAIRTSIVHEEDLARVANETHVSFDSSCPWRAATVARTPAHAIEQADRLIRSVETESPANGMPSMHVHVRHGVGASGKVAFLFSGQGSQYVGMGADLAMAFADARSVWDVACDHPELTDLQLHQLAFPASAWSDDERAVLVDKLNAVRHAQPVIAAVGLAQLAMLRQAGLKADMCAGHSFGEVMALHHAGVIDASSTLGIANSRASVMADAAASSTGSMMAVQTSIAHIRELLAELPHAPVIANDNSPRQVVLSGAMDQLQQARSLCQAHSVATTELPVSTAFHSPLVADATAPFAQRLQACQLGEPTLPVYANCTATPYPAGDTAIRELLSRQIAEPVLFRQSVEAMYAAGARVFVEIGPGDVLAGLVRSILPGEDVSVVSLDRKRENGCIQFLSAMGELAALGVDIDVAALFDGMPAPAKRPERSAFAVDLVGSNYNKPYPPQQDIAALASSVAQQETLAVTVGTQTDIEGAPLAEHATHSAICTTGSSSASHLSTVSGSLGVINNRTSTMTSELSSVTTTHSGSARLQGNSEPLSELDDRAQLLRDVSQLHAQYLASVSAAHEKYLNLAAGLIGNVAQMPADAVSQQAFGTASGVSFDTAIADLSVPAQHTAEQSPTVSKEPPPAAINGATNGTVGPGAQMSQGTHAATMPRAPHESDAPNPATTSAPTNGAATSKPEPSKQLAAATKGNGVESPGVSADMVRELIAEKTGYPAEMIEDDMDLSGELGIDSIKQVEILSALRAKVPELKALETEQIGQLRTIRKIADFFA